MEENKKIPKGLIEALHNIREEDLKYGGTLNLEETEEAEMLVPIERSEYEKLLTAKVVLGIIHRDARKRKEAILMGNLPDCEPSAEPDFVERVLGVTYMDLDAEPDEPTKEDLDDLTCMLESNEMLANEVEALRKFIREHPGISENEKVGVGAFEQRGVYPKRK